MEIINNDNIIKLLYSYNPWWRTLSLQKEMNKPMKRLAYYEAQKKFLHTSIKRAILLSGARRTGKTTIMYQIIDKLLSENIPAKNILFLSFDHPLLKMSEMDAILDIYRQNISSDEEIYLFFDEIQYAKNWDSWMKILYDTLPFVRIMATGSASPILLDKVAESGLGRWTVVLVPTLSFYEYCELLKLEKLQLPQGIKPTQLYLLDKNVQTDIFMKLSKFQTHFLRYLQVGGFPELALSNDDLYAQKILREDIIEKALKRDLPALYGSRNVLDLEKIFLFLCYNTSNIINIEALAKELNGVSRPTVEKYIGQLENANLIYISKPIVNGGKKVLKSQNKIYIADAAMRNSIVMNDNIFTNPEELGIIAETTVYKHIKAFYYNENATVGYFRDGGQGKEIDIVVKMSNDATILIEVKYREESIIKETDAVVTMAKKNQPSLVITKRDTDFGLFSYGEKTIYKVPACAFLYLLGRAENELYNKS